MKKILLLLLLATFSIQAQTLQNPTFGTVKIKNNTTSTTATKVNVQENDGTINTISKSDLVNVVEVNDVPSLPLIGEVGKIYVVKNLNKIYRWNGTFYQELAVTDISGLQAQLDLKSNLSDITLQRAYDTSTDKKIQTLAIRPFTLKAQTAAASDNVFVIENSSGFEVASVGAQGKLSAISASVEGNVTGNFFIKRSSPANNILLAGGGDLAQSTAFNKNFGLNAGDVVGANTLLNQYATTPSDWTAQSYVLNSVVFYGGKQWIAKIATVAGDVPSVSSKWEEITFEALSNKTVTVDQTIIDGSINAVSGNAVFDGLALKSNIGHTHVASQITDLSKASVGLGDVDNTSDLSKPLSTATQTALNGKENSFTKNTAFNKNFGTTVGTVAGGKDSRILNGQTAFGWGNHASAGYALTTGSNINQSSFRTALGLGSNAYTSTAYLPLTGGTVNGSVYFNSTTGGAISFQTNSLPLALMTSSQNIIGAEASTTDFNTYVYGNNPYGIWTNGVKRVTVGGDGSTTFTGTISASPAVNPNQVVVKSQLDAVVGTSGTFTVTGIQNATYMLAGKILTIYLSASFTGVSGGFIQGSTFTLPNGYISADFLAGRFVGNGSSFNGTSTPLTAWAEEMSNTSLRYNISGTGAVNHKSFITISLRIQ